MVALADVRQAELFAISWRFRKSSELNGSQPVIDTDVRGVNRNPRRGACKSHGSRPPEIAVDSAHRGTGVGSALRDELFTRSAGKYEALSLNAYQRNPAQHLYRAGHFVRLAHGRGAFLSRWSRSYGL